MLVATNQRCHCEERSDVAISGNRLHEPIDVLRQPTSLRLPEGELPAGQERPAWAASGRFALALLAMTYALISTYSRGGGPKGQRGENGTCRTEDTQQKTGSSTLSVFSLIVDRFQFIAVPLIENFTNALVGENGQHFIKAGNELAGGRKLGDGIPEYFAFF